LTFYYLPLPEITDDVLLHLQSHPELPQLHHIVTTETEPQFRKNNWKAIYVTLTLGFWVLILYSGVQEVNVAWLTSMLAIPNTLPHTKIISLTAISYGIIANVTFASSYGPTPTL
jgi:hypothetical protein